MAKKRPKKKMTEAPGRVAERLKKLPGREAAKKKLDKGKKCH